MSKRVSNKKGTGKGARKRRKQMTIANRRKAFIESGKSGGLDRFLNKALR